MNAITWTHKRSYESLHNHGTNQKEEEEEEEQQQQLLSLRNHLTSQAN